MAKYLVKVSYNTDKIKNLLKEGIPDRRKIVEDLIAPMGGKLEAFYYAFGGYGVFCVSNIPDDVTTGNFTETLNRSGLVDCLTTMLISPEDIDTVKDKSMHYSLGQR